MLDKTQETPRVETIAQIVKSDPDGRYPHLPRYRCRGCGVTVVNDVWCDECLTAQTNEADNQPPIFVGEWED